MAQTIEERLNQLEKAHSRLNNQYQNLLKDFELLNSTTKKINEDWYQFYKGLDIEIKYLKRDIPQQEFIDGNRYKDIIEEIISSEDVIWNKQKYTNLLVKLKSRPEVYSTFVLERNKPRINDKVTFIFNLEEKKLLKFKCL